MMNEWVRSLEGTSGGEQSLEHTPGVLGSVSAGPSFASTARERSGGL